MRMTITEIRSIVRSVLLEQEEVKVEPTEKCVDGHFSRLALLDPEKFQNLEDYLNQSEKLKSIAGIISNITDGISKIDFTYSFSIL